MGLFGKKIKDPIPGTAHVLSVKKPIERARYVNCKLDLVVQAPGIEPFQATAKKAQCRWDRVPQPGATIAVTLDRGNPGAFEVNWDELLTHQELIDARAQEVMGDSTSTDGADVLGALKAQFPGAEISFEGAAAPSASTPGDSRVEQLERLVSLHASGALTDDEFASEKARILRS